MSDRIRLIDVRKRFWSRTGIRMITSFLRPSKERRSFWFWALDGVSLQVTEPGKGLAIVGPNGSGKTTLLRIITGAMQPTSGLVMVHGRVVSLLELFAGLQFDYTGRENIYLNGLLLGMRRHQIQRSLNSIASFAGIEPFLDMPVRHYSLGMQMRLGFSIAVHTEAQILLMDEVWGIGDIAFQSKSLERLIDMKRRGVILIVVSHDLNIVRYLAEEALWLDEGRPKALGPTEAVLTQYLQTIQTASGAPVAKSTPPN